MASAAMTVPTQAAVSGATEDSRHDQPRPYSCTVCPKAFHRLEHLSRHIRTHTGEKPHGCQYPGCSKRFSRSDELTRHSRIHTNPNSRRGKHNQQAAAAAMVNGALPEGQVVANIMPPPPYTTYHNPAAQTLVSPNVSPPSYAYAGHPSPYSNQTSPYGSYVPSNGGVSPEAYSRSNSHGGGMNMLATAASHLAQEGDRSSYSSPAVSRTSSQKYSTHHSYSHSGHSRHHPYDRSFSGMASAPASSRGQTDLPSRGSGTGLAAYHYTNQNYHSQPMSRAHSHDEDDHYAHRMAKRSRPASPFSTNPPSPTFSTGSYSPTPGHTPAMTPGTSPRMRAKHGHFIEKDNNQLPGIRALSLHQTHTPALEPLEPSTEANGIIGNQSYTPYSRSQNTSSSGLRITDIINREDGATRKLPIPTPPGLDAADQMLPSFIRSGESSAAGSVREGFMYYR